jgi:thiamine biosynthesis lipoprotein
VVLFLAFVVLPLFKGGERPYEGAIVAMSTRINFVIYAEEQAGREAVMAMRDRISELVAVFDVHDNNSVIRKVNRAAGKGPVKVPEEFVRCLEKAVEVGSLSGGALDVTVRPVLSVWKNAAKAGRLPRDADLAAARRLVDFRKIIIDRKSGTVELPEAGMKLDLGAVAKGFIVDESIKILEAHGIKRAMVEAGGDLFVLGTKPPDELWEIGIRDPRFPGDKDRHMAVVKVRDAAVTTSGNYERRFKVGGREYSHIVDPRTGLPADAVPQVTIIAPDCATADALATALSVLGVKAGLALIESMAGVEALLITIEDGKIIEHPSSGFCMERGGG